MARIDGKAGSDVHNVAVERESQPKVPKKRGRPRLDNAGNGAFSVNRRLQMREAQKTYRIKKEAAIESCKTRTTELEQKLQKMVDLLIDCHESSSHLNLHVTHPLVYKHLQKMKDHLAPDSGAFNQTPVDQNSSTNIDLDDAVFHTLSNMNHSTHTSMFGYEVSDHLVLNNESSNIDLEYGQSSQQTSSDSNITWDLEMPPYPGLRDSDRLFGRSTRVAYCFQEPMFGRRMHRYYLEYAYRMFVDRRADPSVIYRIFRMVPCIRDKEKMIPYFRNLVHAGIGERLEILSLPFYCIGDAGRHYKRKDSLGNLTYPTNTRLPRRVLGILPTTERSTESSSQSGRGHLQLFGLDGEWFDCYDVEGYLIERGVDLEENTLFAEYNPRLNPIPGQGLIFGSSLFGTSLRDDTQSDIPIPSAASGKSKCVLDLECFFALLLGGFMMLGRAPGFKRSDVELAFKSALRIITQN